MPLATASRSVRQGKKMPQTEKNRKVLVPLAGEGKSGYIITALAALFRFHALHFSNATRTPPKEGNYSHFTSCWRAPFPIESPSFIHTLFQEEKHDTFPFHLLRFAPSPDQCGRRCPRKPVAQQTPRRFWRTPKDPPTPAIRAHECRNPRIRLHDERLPNPSP